MDIEAGNAGSLDTGGSGWFVGHGSWNRSDRSPIRGGRAAPADLRFMPRGQPARDIQIKWMVHPTGDPRGDGKPPSVGRTLSVLVSATGRFRLEFSPDGRFLAADRIVHTLRRHGDYVLWGANIHHRWQVEQTCTILTVRWTPFAGGLADPAAG